MEGSGTDQGIIRSNPNTANNSLSGPERYTPLKGTSTNTKSLPYETPTSGFFPRAESRLDYSSLNPNFSSSNFAAAYQHKPESPKREYSSISKKLPYESLRQSQVHSSMQDRSGTSPSKRDLIMQLESVKKQRDYFETEFRRTVREHHEKSLRSSQIQGPESYGETESDLRREINAMKVQHQGETKRLNETITTLKLENAGLRNLRNILEAELESLKNVRQQADLNRDKIARLEVEIATLKNQAETADSLLRSKNEEFRGLETQYKAQLNEKNDVIQELREKLNQAEFSESMRSVLFSIEVERLHNIIDDLYNRIDGMKQTLDNEIQNVRDEYKVQLEAKDAELKASQGRIKEIEWAVSDEQTANKKLREEVNRAKLQESELEKDVEHWKERYRIIEGSHKYLVEAIEKMKAGNPSGFKGSFPNTSQLPS